jgi:hypothetical protein
VAQTIGQDWRSMQQVCFDLQLASNSLRLVDAAAIPAVSLPLPVEISEVRFRADLTGHPMPYPDQMIESSEFFRAAVPDRTRLP